MRPILTIVVLSISNPEVPLFDTHIDSNVEEKLVYRVVASVIFNLELTHFASRILLSKSSLFSWYLFYLMSNWLHWLHWCSFMAKNTNFCLEKQICIWFAFCYGHVLSPTCLIFNANLCARISNAFAKFEAKSFFFATRKTADIETTDRRTWLNCFRIYMQWIVEVFICFIDYWNF